MMTLIPIICLIAFMLFLEFRLKTEVTEMHSRLDSLSEKVETGMRRFYFTVAKDPEGHGLIKKISTRPFIKDAPVYWIDINENEAFIIPFDNTTWMNEHMWEGVYYESPDNPTVVVHNGNIIQKV